jgi:hypothetical protein
MFQHNHAAFFGLQGSGIVLGKSFEENGRSSKLISVSVS